MNNLWYSFRELKNSFIFKVIILIQITMAIILLYRVNEIKNYENAKLNLMKTITEDKVIYSMMSKYKSLDDFSKDSEDLNKFSELYKAIQNKYNLIVVTYGGILVKDFENIDEFLDQELHKYDDEYKSINSLQCNSNFFETFNIKLSQGNLNEFNNYNKLDDKEMEGKIIPIILGDSYKKIFKLNDIIETKYTNYKVEGFLEKNQFYLDKGIYDPTRAKNLNTFAIAPIPNNISVSNLNNALLINENNVNADFYSIQKEIDGLAKKYDVKLSITNPQENIDSFIDVINYNANIKILIVYIVIFFVIIGLLAIFSNRINARRKEFSLHIMHGATYSDIYMRVFLEHLYLFILSIIISIYFLIRTKTKIVTDIINFDLGAFAQTTLIVFGIVTIVALVPIYNISKNRLNYLIKGE